MKILLIEDDHMIGASLVLGLRDDQYTVDWVRDGESALTCLQNQDAGYVLALLDWALPRKDGIAVLTALRAAGNAIPVLMITARDGLNDRIAGLDHGADDYLVKPFELAEVKARMRSLLRRSSGRLQNVLRVGSLQLDPSSHAVKLGDREISLTSREFVLLRTLMERPTTVLSRAQLEASLYDWSVTVDSNAVEFLIHGVRKKLGADCIENVRGVGWRLGTPD